MFAGMIHRAVAVLVALVLLGFTTDVVFADDLKGYSIDATYTSAIVPGIILTGRTPMHLEGQRHDRIYISLLGNVFVYSDMSTGYFASHDSQESHLDQAKTVSGNRMVAWTVEPGRLLKVVKVVEGVSATIFTVDPSKTTCSLSFEMQPDPQTGRTVMLLPDGATAVIKAVNASSVICAVRKGNLFASDQ